MIHTWLYWLIPSCPALTVLAIGVCVWRKKAAAARMFTIVSLLTALAISLMALAGLSQWTLVPRAAGYSWISLGAGQLSLDVSLLVDRFGCMMCIVTAALALAATMLSERRAVADEWDDVARAEDCARYGWLLVMALALFLVALGGSLVTVFAGWTGVGGALCMLLDQQTRCRSRAAGCATHARCALVTWLIGDAALLAAIALVFARFRTLDLAGLLEAQAGWSASRGEEGAAAAIGLLLMGGVTGRLAQVVIVTAARARGPYRTVARPDALIAGCAALALLSVVCLLTRCRPLALGALAQPTTIAAAIALVPLGIGLALCGATLARVVAALGWLARQFERWIVSGGFDGLALLMREMAASLRAMQRGRIQGYGVAMLAGVIVLLTIYLVWAV